MPPQEKITETLGTLQEYATAGYALAFHLKYTTPTYLFQTYPAEWLEYYSQNGLLMRDPTVAWSFENTGAVRWSDLIAQDAAGVMEPAAKHGMKFGLTCAVETEGKRSLGSFARGDREFDAAETKTLLSTIHQLHELLEEIEDLSPEAAAELKRMSIRTTRS